MALVHASYGLPGLAVQTGRDRVSCYVLVVFAAGLDHSAADQSLLSQVHLDPLTSFVSLCRPALRRVNRRTGVSCSDLVVVPDAAVSALVFRHSSTDHFFAVDRLV